jgi:methyl-accepting chemotaxis protein-1 (serine sensor receptor)
MRLLANLKVITRLALLGGILALLLATIGTLGLFGMERTNDALRTVYEDRTVPATQLGEINSLILHNRINVNAALVTPTPEVIASRTQELEANAARIDQIWKAYTATYLTPEELVAANQFTESRKAYQQEVLRPIVAALRAQQIDEARTLLQQKLRPMAAPLEASLEKLIRIQVDVAQMEYDTAEHRFAVMRWVVAGGIAFGLVFAAMFGLAVARSVVRQLGCEPGEASEIASRVAAGDLRSSILVKSGDQDSLLAQLKAMQHSLVQVVQTVRTNADNVAIGSSQIAQGNMDLSSRTEEQASAVEQTASSMEQLGATVKQNAASAQQANELAGTAREVAGAGGEVVGQVVETMRGIEESSKRIAEIISVIDGIAFQTNILALNAAVEAARAGEQGRGFAVVAGEVRTLAMRSATAAKEIKALIGESVDRVERGTSLVARAGQTMDEVVAAIGRVSDITREIDAASREQSVGVSQVGEAVSQIDQTTQQNAALVEESAAAAASLQAQAKQLVQAVAVFRLQEEQAALA